MNYQSHADIEAALIKILECLLCKNEIAKDVDLFTLGADELTLYRLLNKLHQQFPTLQLSWHDLHTNRTLASLINFIHSSKSLSRVSTERAIKEQFSTAESDARLKFMQKYVQKEYGRLPDNSNQNITQEASRHQPFMNLAWALKRDFNFPLYLQELQTFMTTTEIAAYICVELELHLGLRPRMTSTSIKINQTEILKRAVHTPAKTENKVNNVVFILSAPRSGSTLLRLMLAGHFQLFCPPELNLLHHDQLSDWLINRLKRFPRSTHVIQNLMAIMGFTPSEVNYFLDHPEKATIPIADVYAQIEKSTQKTIIVDKTPSYTKHLFTLQQTEALFDQAQYIHLVRHPYAVIDSFVRHRFHKLINTDQNDPYLSAEYVWTQRNQNVLTFKEQTESKRYYLLHYEHLVAQPRETMAGICRFLQISFSENLLNPYEICHHISGPGDYDILQHDTIEPLLGKKWENIKLPYPLQPETIALANILKYQLPYH